MEVYVSRRTSALDESRCLAIEIQVLLPLKTALILHTIRELWAVCTYAMKEGQIRELCFHVFWKRSSPVTALSGTRFLQFVLDNSYALVQILYKTSVPAAFGVQLYFRAIALMCREVRGKA